MQPVIVLPSADYVRLLSFFFFFSSRRRHTRCLSDWSSDVCSSDLVSSLTNGAVPKWGSSPISSAYSSTAGHGKTTARSEERRVGKEGRVGGGGGLYKKKR